MFTKKEMALAFVAVVFAVVMGLTLGSGPTSADTLAVEYSQICPSGVTVEEVLVTPGVLDWTTKGLSSMKAFVVTPTEGCDRIPTQYCLIWVGSSKAGMSCTPVE